MEQILIFLLVLIAVALVALVLIQHGKGADAGAAFGSGASNTMFGSQGSTSFLFKLTFGLAIAFFVILIVLTRMATHQAESNNLNLPTAVQTAPQPASTVPSVPVVPANKS